MKTKQELADGIIYCALGVMEEHDQENFGEEKKWLMHLYMHCSDYQDENFDIPEKEQKKEE